MKKTEPYKAGDDLSRPCAFILFLRQLQGKTIFIDQLIDSPMCFFEISFHLYRLRSENEVKGWHACVTCSWLQYFSVYMETSGALAFSVRPQVAVSSRSFTKPMF